MAGRWGESLHDIRGFSEVKNSLADLKPELVFHLAAQPLVSAGFDDPMTTFDTNVMGTMHVLEAVRRSPTVLGCIVVTTDKVYRPRVAAHRHVEDDPLGAHDPYSASKAAAEHVVDAWRELILRDTGAPVVAVRAGNVIGGGDSAPNRLLPDLVRAFSCNTVCEIRHPDFTRPWQHVLDPLSGYLAVGAMMLQRESLPRALNFGPEQEERVALVADWAAASWGPDAAWVARATSSEMPETELLALDSGLAQRTLGWSPTWATEEAVERTISWWKEFTVGANPTDLCLRDIAAFTESGDRS
jgi:CDP-glucose 4,6-dehydratase